MNLGHFIKEASCALPSDHYPNPRQTIRMVVQSLMGLSHIEIHLMPEKILSPEQLSLLSSAVMQLKNGQPLAYVLKEISFLEWDFISDSRAFIPRPETEALVSMVRERTGKSTPIMSILDMCCGSGVMGLSLALSFPQARAVLIDISQDALQLTMENVMRHELGSRVTVIQSDLWGDVPKDLTFDLIVCNPPYVAGTDHVENMVLEFEPHVALFSHDSGMGHVKNMLMQLDHFLAPGGLAAFELGHFHADALDPWLKAQGCEGTFSWEKDPFGVKRFLFYDKFQK